MKRKCCQVMFLAMASAVLVLTACADVSGTDAKEVSAEAEKKPEDNIRIGISFDLAEPSRRARDREVFTETARSLGADVFTETADGDAQKQKDQIRGFTEQDMDVIVIAAADCNALAEEVRDARNRGIQVISYDYLIQGEQTDLYITMDKETAGTLMAQNIKENLPDGGNIAMICGPENDADSTDVVKGFEQELEDGPWNVVCKSHVQSLSQEDCSRAAEDAFANTEEKIDAVMCGSEEIGSCVSLFLENSRLSVPVIVTGLGTDEDTCRRIEEGLQTMAVYRPADTMAQQAAQYAVKLAEGKQLAGDVLGSSDVKLTESGQAVPYIGVEPLALTAGNMDSVLEEDI